MQLVQFQAVKILSLYLAGIILLGISDNNEFLFINLSALLS